MIKKNRLNVKQNAFEERELELRIEAKIWQLRERLGTVSAMNSRT